MSVLEVALELQLTEKEWFGLGVQTQMESLVLETLNRGRFLTLLLI